MNPLVSETFSRAELLAIVGTVGLTDDQLENWQRDGRQFVLKWERTGEAAPPQPVGRGTRREYTFLDAVFLATLKVLASYLPNMVIAKNIAQPLTIDIGTRLLNPSWEGAFDVYAIHPEKFDPDITPFTDPNNRFTRTPLTGNLGRTLDEIFCDNPQCHGAVAIIHTGYICAAVRDGIKKVLDSRIDKTR
jgi:hypothetical protein